MANNHGGPRQGAGRPSKAQKHAGAIERAEKKIADRLPRVISNLLKLADGGYKRETEVWKPAGLIQIARTEEVEGPQGLKVLRFLEPAFPELPPDQLVCIERKVEFAEPDFKANVYLADRIMGRPTQRIEVEDEPEEELDDSLDRAIMEIFGEKPDAENQANDEPNDENENPLEADEPEIESAAINL